MSHTGFTNDQPDHFAGPFNIWKDADPDMPILKEAKTEYSKLE
jgi:hypothetical protein